MDTPLSTSRLKLRLLICNPKSYGARNITCKGSISNGTTPRTKEDPYLPAVYSYECKSGEEWQRLTTGISRQTSNQNAFHAYAILVDTSLPPSPAARVGLAAGAFYEVLRTQCSVPSVISQQQEGSEPSEAHNLSEGGATPSPATISSPVEESPSTLADAGAPSGVDGQPPSTGEDSQSGSAGESLAESEPTLSAAEALPVSADTPESTEPASTPNPDTSAEAAGDDPQGAGTAPMRAPAPAKPKPAKKPGKK